MLPFAGSTAMPWLPERVNELVSAPVAASRIFTLVELRSETMALPP